MSNMYLLIDPSVSGKMSLAFFDSETIEWDTYEGSNRSLLAGLDESLTKRKKTVDDVLGIAVVVGEGSFTSTRVAVTVANTFSYAKQIPIIAVAKQEIEEKAVLLSRLLSQKPGLFIAATYSGEPNVGGVQRSKAV